MAAGGRQQPSGIHWYWSPAHRPGTCRILRCNSETVAASVSGGLGSFVFFCHVIKPVLPSHVSSKRTLVSSTPGQRQTTATCLIPVTNLWNFRPLTVTCSTRTWTLSSTPGTATSFPSSCFCRRECRGLLRNVAAASHFVNSPESVPSRRVAPSSPVPENFRSRRSSASPASTCGDDLQSVRSATPCVILWRSQRTTDFSLSLFR